MPAIGTVRAAIVAALGSLAGVGIVHGFERYAKREADFRALFETNGRVCGWVVRRVATAEQSVALGRSTVTHRWQIRGYLSLDDAARSEEAFDDLVEAFRDAVRADETLGGTVATTVVENAAGVQVDDSGPVMFAGVLCHSARLTLNTRHFE